jgi:hypothetical protein
LALPAWGSRNCGWLLSIKLKTRVILSIAMLAWCAAAGGAAVAMWRYAAGAGASKEAPAVWPAGTRISRSSGTFSVLMFVHPRCPCSRASMGELDRIVASVKGRAEVTVLFVRPPDAPRDWEQTDLWRSAAAIRGVVVKVDENGREALQFGARTSGQVVVYDEEGRLRFQGGITGARGHAGDNDGESAVVGLILTNTVTVTQTPVFGCGLGIGAIGESCPVRNESHP